MEMAAAEGKQSPLDQDQDLDWSEHFSFPRELIRVGPGPGRAAGAHPLGGVGGVSVFGAGRPRLLLQPRLSLPAGGPEPHKDVPDSLRNVYLSVFRNAPTFVGRVMSL